MSKLMDISEISVLLAGRVEALCAELLPEGKRINQEWIGGGPGGGDGSSMSVHLTGSKAGVWRRFSSDAGGDALDLVNYLMFDGQNASKALEWARAYLGIDDRDPASLKKAKRQARGRKALADAEAAGEARRKTGSAMRIWLEARKDLTGTPVDHYLRGRSIDLRRFSRRMNAIRFHPRLGYGWDGGRRCFRAHYPAMVAAVHRGNEIVGCHRTYLEARGGIWRKADVENAKLSLGPIGGGGIRVWRGQSGLPLHKEADGAVVVLTEGLEDAFSIAQEAPHYRVLCAINLGNLAKVELPDNVGLVMIAADDDAGNPEAVALLERARRAHVRAGRQVRVIAAPGGAHDFNDALRDQAKRVHA